MITRKGYEREGYHRKAYTRKDGVKVKAAWIPPTKVPPVKIKDRGAKGKGKKLINMADDRHLSKFGYSFKESAAERHRALSKAVEDYGKGWAVHRLNAVRNMEHRTNPSAANKAQKDIDWIHENL